MLKWNTTDEGAWAASEMNDDGSTLAWEITRTENGWSLAGSARELLDAMPAGHPKRDYESMDSAKVWAERTEREMLANADAD